METGLDALRKKTILLGEALFNEVVYFIENGDNSEKILEMATELNINSSELKRRFNEMIKFLDN